ncbi:hypothetical protein D3C84_1111770 [compost metagenome]
MHPPQAQGHGDATLVQLATGGDQHGQVGHVQEDRRQQFEEAALARIDLGQRHGQQGDDEHQQRNRQAPLQLGLVARVLAADQLGGR